MIPENATYAFVGAMVDELVRAGIAHLCLCPGSRSTPVALCAARHPGIRVWTLIDERSAAFFALGLAKGSRRPAAVLSTSGTAAANFFPAVIEARYGRTPLIVLTADRPRELRDTGANQTIDQVRLYGDHAKWFVDVAPPEASDEMLRYARGVVAQAVAKAVDHPAGPVHLNIPLREPLVPLPGSSEMPPPDRRTAELWEGRPSGRPFAAVRAAPRVPDAGLVGELAEVLSRSPRGAIVCGPSDDPEFPAAVSGLAAAFGYPILADPLSQVRCGPHDRSLVIDAYDAMLRVADVAGALTPEIILRIGGVPASKPLAAYLQLHAGARQVIIDAGGGWPDPNRLATDVIYAEPSLVCEAIRSVLAGAGSAAPTAWAMRWQRLNAAARAALQAYIGMLDELFEGKVFSELAALLPDGAVLYVGNSMPVRDLEAFFPSIPGAIRFLGNRGASGIDGVISSALGIAAVRDPVVLVLGDLSFYHDMNGLLAARLHALKATIVLINNDGGGVFSFLPQAAYPEHFEKLFGTPHGLDFRPAAEMYGAQFTPADSWERFRDAMRESLGSKRLSIIEIRTDRRRNVALHRDIWSAVESALRAELCLTVPGVPS